ncbi:hypothetical protein B0T18DRAFT_138079 [Schizothecium vesticola]|uniref:AAA+ ATPase domain-containing protein n=1 Tax=Schizothecium vesticola TaxID=314040 RepID=A0AA40K4Q6_9PEZI|nr:hypothetical protein B0T18DRAFT_138079 [Schizothecium vesticola]
MDSVAPVGGAGAREPRPSAGLDDDVRALRATVRELEKRIATMEPLQRALSMQRNTWPALDARTEVTDDTDFSAREYTALKPSDTIPLVRECTFAEFKNRFSMKEGRYAVDVFTSGLLMDQEMQEEYRLRDKLFEAKTPSPSMKIVNDKALASVVKNATVSEDFIQQAQQDDKWPRRIRIQSPALLRILARVNRERWSDRPRTYYRPFNSIIHHQGRVREALRELESKWGAYVPQDSDDESTYIAAAAEAAGPRDENNDATSHDGGQNTSDEDEVDEQEDDDYEKVANCPKALECLRAFVKYIDHKIIPDSRRFENQDAASNAMVRFSDLWYLFRTGDLVYRQTEGELPDRRDSRTGKHIWKAHRIVSVPERIASSATDDTEIRDSAVSNDHDAFTVECFYIDYTGEEFCIVTKTVEIEQYTGEIPVNTLPVYPLRFCQNYNKRQLDAEESGRKLLEFIETKHCSYNGWTLTHNPSGDLTTDVNGVQQQQPEHINSEVMVDFGEAFQTRPDWRPQRTLLRKDMGEGLTLPDDFRIRWWSSKDRTRLLGETTEIIPVKSGAAVRQYNQFIKEDGFIQAVNENARRGRLTKGTDLKGDSLALLTGRVFAFVFQERKFAQLSVAKLLPSPKTGLALDSLKIPPAVKRAIQGSIQGHLRKKAAERKIGHSRVTSLDLIQGKGTGLFILLHGVPGVGKTATAEAIARANGLALLSITVGDLGMTPEKLETSLRGIFRLASIWNCILLLDEVDTFFSQRSRADTATSKNAMVSVFLRVLDYHDGILFLTTNRAGVLDEAFKSRIHYKIYYPDLSLEQTLDIWKLNIDRVKQIEVELSQVENRPPLQINEKELLVFAERHFKQSNTDRGGTRWNGRQIRNVFQVALSLAYYEHYEENAEKETDKEEAPVLHVRHFETMHQITTSFESYRNSVRDATDAELALQSETRNDKFSDNLTRHWQSEYRELSLREAQAESESYPRVGTSDVGGGGGGDVASVSTGAPSRFGPPDTMNTISNQIHLHPGASVAVSNRPRSSSQNSPSSPPNMGQWRDPPQQRPHHQLRHMSSRDSVERGYHHQPPQPRSPNFFGNTFSGSPVGSQQGFHGSGGGGRGGMGYYNDSDKMVQTNMSNTPRGPSPGLMNYPGGGGRMYGDHQQQQQQQQLYDGPSGSREQLVAGMMDGNSGRHRDSQSGRSDESGSGYYQLQGQSPGQFEQSWGGHRDSMGSMGAASGGTGMRVGQEFRGPGGMEPETDLVVDSHVSGAGFA